MDTFIPGTSTTNMVIPGSTTNTVIQGTTSKTVTPGTSTTNTAYRIQLRKLPYRIQPQTLSHHVPQAGTRSYPVPELWTLLYRGLQPRPPPPFFLGGGGVTVISIMHGYFQSEHFINHWYFHTGYTNHRHFHSGSSLTMGIILTRPFSHEPFPRLEIEAHRVRYTQQNLYTFSPVFAQPQLRFLFRDPPDSQLTKNGQWPLSYQWLQPPVVSDASTIWCLVESNFHTRVVLWTLVWSQPEDPDNELLGQRETMETWAWGRVKVYCLDRHSKQ